MRIKVRSHLPSVFIIMLLIQVGLMGLGEGLFTDRLNKVSGMSHIISASSFIAVYAVLLHNLNKLDLPHKAESGPINSSVFWVIWSMICVLFVLDFLAGNFSTTYSSESMFQIIRGNLIYQVKAVLFVVILKYLRDKKYLLVFLISSLFFIVDGRRWLMLFFSVLLISYGKFRFFTTIRNAVVLVPILFFVFLFLSTAWDQMRNVSTDGSSIFNTMYNAFEYRWSMFYFNSEVIEYVLEHGKQVYGALTLIELNNSLPGPIKIAPYVDTDILIEKTISIGASDFPTNIISFLIFDYGLAYGLFLSFLLLKLPFQLSALGKYHVCKFYMYSYSLVVLASLEFQMVTYFILLRDILLIIFAERFILIVSYLINKANNQIKV